jgi:hypothetical protein
MRYLSSTLFTALLGVLCNDVHAQSNQDLLTQLQQLRQEMQQLKNELTQLKSAQAVNALQSPTPTPIEPSVAAPRPVAATASATDEQPESRVSLFGYGEMNYTRALRNTADTMATARRGVLGFGYRFTERTRFAAELEIENAVVSSSDQGEAAFEQLYIEHDLNEDLSVKAGLFLLPLGYLNQSHEPTRYYGVTRNQIETAIIPTTWREMGLGLQGRTDSGWRWNTGLVTSFDLNKWPTSSDGAADTKSSPLGAIHQEGSLAKAAAMAYYGVVNYDGHPGVNVGGGLFKGGLNQRQPATRAALKDAQVTLYELHAKWQYQKWELSGLTALGQFDGVANFNSTLSADNPVPKQFKGWYAQAAYRAWQKGDYSLIPFARYERLNTALGYAGLPDGVTPTTDPDTRTLTAGFSFYLHPQVVLKMDVQRYLNNSQLDRVNLGVGFHY